MTQPLIDSNNQQSLARLPYQSIGLPNEVDAPLQDLVDGSSENLVRIYEIERPLVSQELLLFTVIEVAHILSLSRTKVYELLYAGAIPSVKIGASRRVRRADLENFVSNLELAN